MNKYALTLILKTDLDEKARKEILESVTKKFGKLEKEELWGAKDLAYPIKHLKKGYYAHYFFEGEPSSILSIDKDLKLNENIIRYLLVRV
ncbi:MAG: 30S ribosomal protein S6 [Candidatus Daviesbacteria bacterium]|nr:30S ribosomal protein S6 [Candidatus Daviesbacteria bacterium]